MNLLVTLSLLTALKASPNHLTTPNYQNISKQTSTQSEVANLLPGDTPLVGFVSTKVEDWKTLERFPLFKSAFAVAATLFPPNQNLNYESIINTALKDKIALVMMPQVDSKKVSADASFLMLAPIKDDKLLQPFLDSLKANKRQYKGVTILEWKSPRSKVATQQVLPDWKAEVASLQT